MATAALTMKPSHGSLQLRRFRIVMRDGETIEVAAAIAGIPIGEAKMIAADDARSPPPPEAFHLFGPTTKGSEMAQAAKNDDGAHEVHTMDFDRALEIVKGDINPAATKVGDHAQEMSTAYKLIKKECHIQPQSVKAAIKIADMEDAHRDDYLRGMVGMLNKTLGFELLTFHGGDLVDQAEGNGGRPNLRLATMQSDDDDFDEASDEELAGQEGRPSNEDEDED